MAFEAQSFFECTCPKTSKKLLPNKSRVSIAAAVWILNKDIVSFNPLCCLSSRWEEIQERVIYPHEARRNYDARTAKTLLLDTYPCGCTPLTQARRVLQIHENICATFFATTSLKVFNHLFEREADKWNPSRNAPDLGFRSRNSIQLILREIVSQRWSCQPQVRFTITWIDKSDSSLLHLFKFNDI